MSAALPFLPFALTLLLLHILLSLVSSCVRDNALLTEITDVRCLKDYCVQLVIHWFVSLLTEVLAVHAVVPNESIEFLDILASVVCCKCQRA
jgi:hypothetical protein